MKTFLKENFFKFMIGLSVLIVSIAILMYVLSIILPPIKQCVNIPDANFKKYLVGNTDINTNGDKKIQVSEASAFNGSIYCTNLNISNLKGIEAFTALTELNCERNLLTSLDVSKNTALTYLSCDDNSLTNLDVSKNTALISLNCCNNQLRSLNVSKNTALISLICCANQLTILDVSKNTALTKLECSVNSLKTLDVSKNNALTELSFSHTRLTS